MARSHVSHDILRNTLLYVCTRKKGLPPKASEKNPETTELIFSLPLHTFFQTFGQTPY